MKALTVTSRHKNSDRKETKSIFHRFCPGLPISLTLCPINYAMFGGLGLRRLQSDSLRPGWCAARIPLTGEIFLTCPDWLSCPPLLLHNGYRVSFLAIKRPERDNHPHVSSAEVEERVELYLHPSLSLNGLL